MPELSSLPPRPAPPVYALRFVAGAHFLRTLGLALGVVALAAVLYRNGAGRVVWAMLILHGFVWPHVARALAQYSEDPVRAERRNVLVDSLACGMWIVLMGFNALPSVLFTTMLAMNCIGAGGGKLLWKGMLAEAIACLLTVGVWGFSPEPVTDQLELLACLPLLVACPLAVSWVAWRLTKRVRHQNRVLERVGSIDGMSELLNRTRWTETVERLLDARGEAHAASLLMLDIDNFKQINDQYGHVVGDEVIVRIGQIIRRNMRNADIAGRYGGDEFGIVLYGVDLQGASNVAERIRTSVHMAAFEHAGELRCTVSIGIASLQPEMHSARDWIRQADAALYKAKLLGRDQLFAANWNRETTPA
jgi:diguanylate cyclase